MCVSVRVSAVAFLLCAALSFLLSRVTSRVLSVEYAKARAVRRWASGGGGVVVVAVGGSGGDGGCNLE